MKRDYLKRVGAVMLSFMVFVAFSFVVAPEAYAAKSKGKKTPVVVQIDETWSSTSSWDGSNSGKSSFKYTYNKQGLCTSGYDADGKIVYTHNKKGYVTSEKYYNKEGKLQSRNVYKLKKNGDISKSYFYEGTDKKASSVTSYTYYKKGVTKTMTTKEDGYTYKVWFDKKGNIKKEVHSGQTDVYDKSKDEWVDGTYTRTITNKNTLNKKGNAKKTVSTSVFKDSSGYTDKSVSTTTRSFKYKKGRIVKMVEKVTSKNSEGKVEYTETNTEVNNYTKKGYIKSSSRTTTTKYTDGDTYTYKNTSTYKYKSIKVAKKYRHLYKVKK